MVHFTANTLSDGLRDIPPTRHLIGQAQPTAVLLTNQIKAFGLVVFNATFMLNEIIGKMIFPTGKFTRKLFFYQSTYFMSMSCLH